MRGRWRGWGRARACVGSRVRGGGARACVGGRACVCGVARACVVGACVRACLVVQDGSSEVGSV